MKTYVNIEVLQDLMYCACLGQQKDYVDTFEMVLKDACDIDSIELEDIETIELQRHHWLSKMDDIIQQNSCEAK